MVKERECLSMFMPALRHLKIEGISSFGAKSFDRFQSGLLAFASMLPRTPVLASSVEDGLSAYISVQEVAYQPMISVPGGDMDLSCNCTNRFVLSAAFSCETFQLRTFS